MEVGINGDRYLFRFVHQDLEIRGFIVEKLNLEQNDNEVYLNYCVSLPDPWTALWVLRSPHSGRKIVWIAGSSSTTLTLYFYLLLPRLDSRVN